ncbi:MAG: orotate phosphoribosyltransferase [Candidatus Kerfeldbacteria bacterium]|nr:orotate phosphoribosyltransferase [Candidatus Kerfeldbacteria bacterium]
MATIIDMLKETGAILTNDHFVLTSGKHASIYINKDAMYPHTEKASAVGKMFAEQVRDITIDVVVGPALGGIILSQWMAYHLTQLKGQEVLGVYTEKTPEKNQVFTRGYDKLIAGKKVIVVEDLTSTGGSAKKVVESVRTAGGEVVGVAVMVNRNPEEVNADYFGAPFFALGELKVEAYEEADCPMCAADTPVNTAVGHGKKYMEAKK